VDVIALLAVTGAVAGIFVTKVRVFTPY